MKKGIFLVLFSVMIAFGAMANQITSTNFFQKGEISVFEIYLEEETTAERVHLAEDKQIILDIKNVRASKNELRGIDTSEFPGSTVFISGYEKPGNKSDIRYSVQLRDNARSKLRIQKNKITLLVENRFGVFASDSDKSNVQKLDSTPGKISVQTIDQKKIDQDDVEAILTNFIQSGRRKFFGRKISINVQQVRVDDLLRFIADTSGFNIVLDAEITSLPPMNLNLNDIPWDQALDIVLKLTKLVSVKLDNILQITTVEKVRSEQQRELENQGTKLKLEPLVTKVFPINFATLEELSTILKDYITETRGRVTMDQRTNSLIVKDTVEVIEKLKKIIEVLDTETPQILIEAKIVETTESFERRIGLTRGISFGYDPIANNGTDLVQSGPGFVFSTAPTLSDPGTFGFSVNVYKRLRNLSLSLQLMEQESKGKVISSPRVITQNKRPATITSTETTSFRIAQPQSSSASGPAVGVTGLSSFQQVSATLNLNVTPQVTNDGSIVMAVTMQKQSFGTKPFADGPPNLTTRNINTAVLVDNGSTVVLGGLYSNGTQITQSGVPILKDLPLLGWLFKTPDNTKTDRSELVIFLTPRIINQEEAGLTNRSESL